MKKKELPKSVEFIKGVGSRYSKILEKLNIKTIEDLLFYFPRDYEDRRNITSIKYLSPGQLVTVKADVIKVIEERPRPGMKILKVSFSDGSDVLNGVWFNQPYLKKQFKKGQSFYISGQLNEKSWRFKKKEIYNPVFELFENGDNIHTGRVVPIYSLTNGATQKYMRQVVYNALDAYACHLPDLLSNEIKEKYDFYDIEKSIWGLHFPEDRRHYIKARKRLAFEELYLLQLIVLNRKKGLTLERGIKHLSSEDITKEFLGNLSFSLTNAQEKVWAEIKHDMERDVPMQRLLQGDVGSGKTIIATLSLIKTIANGYQGVLMAPTEILAEQHFLKLDSMLRNLGFNAVLIIGSMSQSERKENIEKIKLKQADLIIGTHALFQESIEYNKIGLVVIDEQHRFGVEQRFRLKEKGENPDLLVMTATPIPRTLALTVYGDLDVSIIDELPLGRNPVITTWRKDTSRSKIYQFVKEKIDEGRQAYIVCPLIEPSEEIKAISAEEMFENLTNRIFSEYKVALLHSKLASEEKKNIMEMFRTGHIDILVSTTVIEVGVDVANASIMIIENAERFGLAQLHQLRGRVGRGQYQSYCILIASPNTEEGIKRLEVMTESTDGFKIAEEDLKIRGPGEFFGTKQSGLPDLKVADILKDQRIIQKARIEAEKTVERENWEDFFPHLYKKIKEIELKV
ncbi:ATP-dependent DNA helicase RecG [Natronospora cellulosivora (SeqCode)]